MIITASGMPIHSMDAIGDDDNGDEEREPDNGKEDPTQPVEPPEEDDPIQEMLDELRGLREQRAYYRSIIKEEEKQAEKETREPQPRSELLTEEENEEYESLDTEIKDLQTTTNMLLGIPMSEHSWESDDYGNIIETIWVEGDYVWVAGRGDHVVRQYEIGEEGVVWESDDYGGIIYDIWVDTTNGYVYVAGHEDVIVQYDLTEDNPEHTVVWTSDSYGGTIYGIWVEGDYVWAGGHTTQTIRQYEIGESGLVWESANYNGVIRDIWIDTSLNRAYAGGSDAEVVRGYDLAQEDPAETLDWESADHEATIWALYMDGDYIFAGGGTPGIIKQYDTTEDTPAETLVWESEAYGGIINSIFVDGDYVFAGGGTTATVRQYDYTDTENNDYIWESSDYGGTIYSIWVDGDYAYAGGSTTNAVRQYEITTTGYVWQSPTYGGNLNAIWVQGDYVFLAGSTTRTVRKYEIGEDDELVWESDDYGGLINVIWVEGDYVFVGGNMSDGRVKKYDHTDTESNEAIWESDIYGTSVNDIWVDGDYVWVAGGQTIIQYDHTQADPGSTFVWESDDYGGDTHALVKHGDIIYTGGFGDAGAYVVGYDITISTPGDTQVWISGLYGTESHLAVIYALSLEGDIIYAGGAEDTSDDITAVVGFDITESNPELTEVWRSKDNDNWILSIWAQDDYVFAGYDAIGKVIKYDTTENDPENTIEWEIEGYDDDAEDLFLVGDYLFVAFRTAQVVRQYYVPTQYTINFEANGGTPEPDTQMIESGALVEEPDEPTLENHLFDGWFDNEELEGDAWNFGIDVPLSSMTLYAMWLEQFTVTFETTGGTAVPDAHVWEGDPVSQPISDPTRIGYEFNGWFEDDLETEWNFATPITEDTTIYAGWNEVYTITYELDGGENHIDNPSTFVEDNLPIVLGEPTRADYDFMGWFFDDSFETPLHGAENNEIQSTGNVTVHAGWVPSETYNITYNFDFLLPGDVTNPNPATFTIEDLDLTLNDPHTWGYEFLGWFEDELFTQPITEIDELGHITLYAQFTVEYYDIHYDLQGGDNAQYNIDHWQVFNIYDMPLVIGGDLPAIQNPTHPEGYDFIEWTIVSGGTDSFEDLYLRAEFDFPTPAPYIVLANIIPILYVIGLVGVAVPYIKLNGGFTPRTLLEAGIGFAVGLALLPIIMALLP